MKVIEINSKRVGVTIILVGLMLILLGLARNFDNIVKETMLIKDSSGMTKYNVVDKNLTYKLPKGWSTKEEKFQGDEVLYHNNFISTDKEINGFVELWNLKEDLYSFLQKSEKISKEGNIIDSYTISKVNYGNYDGYRIKYVITSKNNVKYNCIEYFLKGNSGIIRFSFFIRHKDYKENMILTFEKIVNTINN